MSHKTCPDSHDIKLLELLGKKHVLSIIKYLGEKESCARFNEIQKELKINAKSLSDRLSELEEKKIIMRKSFDTIPPKVEYRLANIRSEIIEVLNAIHKLEYVINNNL